MSYDYSGYGLNQGFVGEAECFEDISSVWLWLTKEQKIPATSILLMGKSLGSGPTCHQAQYLSQQSRLFRRGHTGDSFSVSSMFRSAAVIPEEDFQPAGVILQSPISSCIRVAGSGLAKTFFYLDMFTNIHKIGDIDCPVLIVHGTSDEVVPYSHGQQLQERSTNLWKFVSLDGAGHNNIEHHFGDQLIQALADFLKHIAEKKANLS